MFKGEAWEREGREIRELVTRFERALAEDVLAFFDDEDLEQIIEHYQDQDELEMALQASEYGLELNPYNALFYIRKADVLFEMRRFDEAMICTDQAALYDPSEIEIYYLRADLYVQKEEYPKAIKCLEEALERADLEEHDQILVEMAEVYGDLEDFDQMFEKLRMALDLNPESEDALTKLWYCVDISEKYEESVALNSQIIDRHPYAYLAWYNLGKAYAGMGLFEKAIESYEFVQAIEEKFGPVYRDTGEALYRLGRYREAISLFLQAIDRNEPDEEVYFRIGSCREKLEEWGGARHHYRKALQLDPYFHEAYSRIGHTYLAQNNREQALRNFKKAIQLDPDHAEYQVELGRLQYDLDHIDQALVSYREALRIRPDYAPHWVQYSRMLAESGAREAAVMAASEAIVHCGDLALLHYVLGACLMISGRGREGSESLQHALDLDAPAHPVLFELFPQLERDPLVLDLIKQYNR
ncbi:MAG: tetratricopeptide repeat protein [Bacteroidetes bacterium]|nr:tetratricopeptide repeat protein [Bacteroidota bacterium]